MYLEADIEEGHVLADIEDEEMYLLGGRYGGVRGDVPAWTQIWRRTMSWKLWRRTRRCTWRQILKRTMSRQIWRRARRCTCFEADIEEDEVMYLEANIEEDYVLADMEEDVEMYLL